MQRRIMRRRIINYGLLCGASIFILSFPVNTSEIEQNNTFKKGWTTTSLNVRKKPSTKSKEKKRNWVRLNIKTSTHMYTSNTFRRRKSNTIYIVFQNIQVIRVGCLTPRSLQYHPHNIYYKMNVPIQAHMVFVR